MSPTLTKAERRILEDLRDLGETQTLRLRTRMGMLRCLKSTGYIDNYIGDRDGTWWTLWKITPAGLAALESKNKD